MYDTVLPRAVSQPVPNFARVCIVRVCIARGVFTLRYAVVRALHVHTSTRSSPVLTDSLSDLEYTKKIKYIYIYIHTYIYIYIYIYKTVSFKCYILDKLNVFHSLFWCVFGRGGESDVDSET